ncbi:MAG: hypothetical protein D6E12_13755 [Desulfovibrio sp.]|nr:MAG: hypothetical protein D6E12_13755 [Desulfovibrio sp.]
MERCLILVCGLLTLYFATGVGLCETSVDPPQGFHAMAQSAPVDLALQLVVVVADDWDNSRATLHRFERIDPSGQWTQVGEPVPCRAGAQGLAWGKGQHFSNPGWGPLKGENDGRAPAGAFAIPRAFGHVSARAAASRGSDLPYTALGDHTVCISDPNSAFYNEVLDTTRLPPTDFEQHLAETMSNEDPRYAWGAMVDHNRFPPNVTRDACVFIRVDGGAGDEAGNDTVMSGEAAEDLALWLDGHQNPMLVQLPKIEYELLAQAWNLPNL